jgi:NDP-sugar pyrophosphorylase family protein
MQCVVLAGGRGVRMKPLTDRLPKALIPVAETPFAHHQLRMLSSQGVQDVVYCVGYRGDEIRTSIGDGDQFGLKVTYVDEGDHLRGTAGALRLAADSGVLVDKFAVLYGDSYLPLELAPVWRASEETPLPALLTVFRNENRWDRSNVVYENGRVLLYDKRGIDPRSRDAEWIDYGLSVLSCELIVSRVEPAAVADLADLYFDLSVEGLLAGYAARDRFYEVGSVGGVRELERFLAGGSAG